MSDQYIENVKAAAKAVRRPKLEDIWEQIWDEFEHAIGSCGLDPDVMLEEIRKFVSIRRSLLLDARKAHMGLTPADNAQWDKYSRMIAKLDIARNYLEQASTAIAKLKREADL
jgi:hypothetical protein